MPAFLRMIGFFVAVVVLMNLLRLVPGIGGLFHGFFAYWIVAILLSAALSRLSAAGLVRHRVRGQIRALGNVESPHNQGKLGTLLLSNGRSARAIPHLERAVEGEPESAEWHYRLGVALLEARRAVEACEEFGKVFEMDEEYAYGAVQLRAAEAALAVGDPAAALARLAVFERNHGPRPESAYWRGVALKRSGDRAAARESFAEVARLAAEGARYQGQENKGWVLRAAWARFF